MIDMAGRIEGAPAGVAGQLEAGESLVDVARWTGLGALGLVAAIAREGLGGEGAEGPSLVQAPPRLPRLEGALSDASLAALIPGATRPARLALAAGLLQILDHWDASHAAAQEADDLGDRSTSAYWHMVAHRREPDPGNALYWARRVGRHPILGELAGDARAILRDAEAGSPAARVVEGASWSLTAMIELATAHRDGSPTAALARRLQRAEMARLLGASASAVGLGTG